MESDILFSLHPFGVGIDVGKNEMVVCRRSSQSGLVAAPTISIPNTTTGIKKLVREFRKQSVASDEPIVLESTGPYHWQAAHDLTKAGFLAKVINPLHTHHAIRHSVRKRKTDKVDAKHLAMLAYQNYGYPFQETKEIAELKALVRHFWYLKHQHTGQIQHEKYLKNYRGIKKFSTSEYIAKQIDLLEPVIVARFKGNDLRYLDSIPGVTPILAATVLAEIYPLNRFNRIEQVIAVSGLDPSVKQSGGKAAHFGKLSKRGSPLLRHALFCSIFGAFTREPWRTLYLNYKERGLHHTEVFCILSRKLLRIMWALLKKRREFDPKYLAVDKSV